VCAAIVIMWIVVPAYITAIGSTATDIVGGICSPGGVFVNDDVRKTVTSTYLFVTYLLPLMAMIFCYTRIVYTIKHNVCPTNT